VAVKFENHNSKILYSVTFKGKEPVIPDDLVWYHHEAQWKHIVDGRINHGMKK
jgi:hypothetical protein